MILICQIVKSYQNPLPQVLLTPGNKISAQYVLAPIKFIACALNKMRSLTKQLL